MDQTASMQELVLNLKSYWAWTCSRWPLRLHRALNSTGTPARTRPYRTSPCSFIPVIITRYPRHSTRTSPGPGML